MSAIDFEKNAKDAVTVAIKADPVAGIIKIVPVIVQHVSLASRASKPPKDGVVASVRGSMQAVLLAGQSVPDAAMGLFDALPGMSLMVSAGAEDVMTWVMEGCADVTPMAGPEIRDALRTRIEEKYMGASAIFEGFCEAAKARG